MLCLASPILWGHHGPDLPNAFEKWVALLQGQKRQGRWKALSETEPQMSDNVEL